MSATQGESVPQPKAESGSQTVEELKKQEAKSGPNTPEEKTYPRVCWKGALKGAEGSSKVRERGGERKEVEVSQEAWKKIENGLIEAALIYGNVRGDNGQIREEKAGILVYFASVLKIINPELDFENPEQVRQAVQGLIEKYPHQAAALGLIYFEEKLKAIRKVYGVETEVIEEMGRLSPPTRPVKEGEIIIDPNKKEVIMHEKTTTYEEFIQTPEGQERRRLFGKIPWFGKRPITKETFDRLFHGKPGKPGRYRIRISTISPLPKLSPFEAHLLDQLDLKGLDMNKPEDYAYLLNSTIEALSIRSEVGIACGKKPEELVNILSDNFIDISGLLTPEDISGAINKRIEDERQKVAREIKKRLDESRQEQTERAIRARLKEKQKELEKELEEARKRMKQGEDGAQTTEAVSQDAIASEVLRVVKGLRLKDGINDLLFIAGLSTGEDYEPPTRDGEKIKALTDLEARKAEIRGELDESRDQLETLKSIQQKLLHFLELQAQETIRQTKEGVERTGPTQNIQESIRELKGQLAEDQPLGRLIKMQEELATISGELAKYRYYFSRIVEINGIKKTVEDWLKEYVRLSKSQEGETTSTGSREIEDIEGDLATVRVLLSWYDVNEQTARNQRILDFEQAEPIPLEDLEGINPELAHVIKSIDDHNQKKTLLRILTVCFGNDLIIPESKEQREKAMDLAKFLEVHIAGLGTVETVDKFKEIMDEIRRSFLGGAQKKPSSQDKTTGNQGEQSTQGNIPGEKQPSEKKEP